MIEMADGMIGDPSEAMIEMVDGMIGDPSEAMIEMAGRMIGDLSEAVHNFLMFGTVNSMDAYQAETEHNVLMLWTVPYRANAV